MRKPKAYEQCAGFMRISDGDNPLDATSVHPESYDAALKLLEKLGISMEELKEIQKRSAQAKTQKPQKPKNDSKNKKNSKGIVIKNTNTAMGKALAAAMGGAVLEAQTTDKNDTSVTNDANDTNVTNGQAAGSLEKRVKDKKKMAQELGIGEITLTDILKELEKPARDPRADMPAPILRSDVMDMKDLKQGMILKGTVRNVIDFGAFVDIGVHQDGLVHISQMTDKYIKHPLEAVSVGDIVDVKVLDVDLGKKRISLTMKLNDK